MTFGAAGGISTFATSIKKTEEEDEEVMTKKKTTTPEIAILLLDRSSKEGSRSVSKGTNII